MSTPRSKVKFALVTAAIYSAFTLVGMFLINLWWVQNYEEMYMQGDGNNVPDRFKLTNLLLFPLGPILERLPIKRIDSPAVWVLNSLIVALLILWAQCLLEKVLSKLDKTK